MADPVRETCLAGCGRSWGVTMTPRERVLCTPCGRPRPDRAPLRYWRGRARNLHWPSPMQPIEYADVHATWRDLCVAADLAETDPVMAAADAAFLAWVRGEAS